jgi:hypothetical protein
MDYKLNYNTKHIIVYLSIYAFFCLLDDAVSDSDHIRSNGMITGKQLVRKDVEGSGRSQVCRTILAFDQSVEENH